MRRCVGVALIVLGLGTAGCGGERTIVGSGHIVSRVVPVKAFSKLELELTFEVTLSRGATPRVTVHADDNLLPEVVAEVSGDTLQLKLKSNVSSSKATLRADVTVPTLEGIDASGASQVRGQLKAAQVKVDLSGASQAQLAGAIDELEVDASGASGLPSPYLTVKSLEVDLSGASNAELTVTESLSADLSGGSSLRYRGSPKVTHSDVSGGSSITHVG